jgi:hypothetical protein
MRHDNKRSSEDGEREPRKPAFARFWAGVKFIGGGPVVAFAPEDVAAGARLIRRLANEVQRRRPAGGPPISVGDGRVIDVEATAIASGASVDEVEAQLACRRRQTVWQAYVTFGLGWFFFGVWLYRAAFTVWTMSAIVTAIEFAPFCAIFFLMAFRCALENYQIRTRRAATALEFLATSEAPFWPN